MGAKMLLESMRDTTGCFQEDVLDDAWGAVPERFRTVDLTSGGLEPTDLPAFTLGSTSTAAGSASGCCPLR
ncbi:hypothetical protein PUR49_00590 [Streptomyces sp. BE147]|uniref:hypothetical protein n=1 Tax=Streptomyces sp. BE147 TaxID=3002524 RepID=UPI002E7A0101|nr:hypothetical protein [Streptomyces sp. BE147]MEE1735066.1 hypothetical protein [Streptomyces sp. BE147]